jgi:hypothetical protein
MSGLIKFKFGFENLLKICFEKLEKKKKRNFSSLGPLSLHSPTPDLLRRPILPSSSFPRPHPLLWAEPNRGLAARQRARV